ncbi:ImmA/IrrE family metallo-endopeptidase [Micrococcales bacterium 31B]|nr:ImmA/IrrE family metallo-endopeptidase [Micrococcales bacterium 31B]
METRVPIAPEMLLWAVERAGWDAETLHRRAPRLDSWARGEHPTLPQLEEFARATHTPFGMLFLPKPPAEPIPIPDMRTLGGATLSKPSVDLLDTIYECQTHQAWYRDYAASHGLEPVSCVGTASAHESPDVVVASIRRELHEALTGETPRRDRSLFRRALTAAIERMGVLVKVSGIVGTNTRRPLDYLEFRGFTLADEWAPLIFINATDTMSGQIFTLIHELAHVFLGGSALSDAVPGNEHSSATEAWCNQVAADVLAHRREVGTAFRGHRDRENLEPLADAFGVSTLVILLQLRLGEFVTDREFEALWEVENHRLSQLAVVRESRPSGGNYYATQVVRLSATFARAVVSSALEGSTGYGDAMSMVGTRKPDVFRRLAETLGVR